MKLRNTAAIRAFVGREPGAEMTASELARRADCAPSTIDHLRNGRMTTCTADLAERIETALGVAPGTIFINENEPKAGVTTMDAPVARRSASIAIGGGRNERSSS
ncbi:helix-turn-helix transcriptional regulator [Nesterenkonia rhizosphaerae]|uniref:HTH cro/C1-type domain-containing protein n=1 Tax=Nesterenkonia rhizosphaerae TaxID=1348272 RepID=A0ABP9FRQ2_9MICC